MEEERDEEEVGRGRGIRKRNETIWKRRAVGVVWFCDFHRRGRGLEGGQHNLPKFLIYFFSDISLITKKSNSLVSHFSYKDITKGNI